LDVVSGFRGSSDDLLKVPAIATAKSEMGAVVQNEAKFAMAHS
jgi:hypothetical protein